MSKPTTRVLALLELLQTHRRMSGRELAQRLEVDGRTLRRYVRTLEDLGIPVTAERGRHGGYMLVPGFKLPPMMFTHEETLAIFLGLLAAPDMGFNESVPATQSARAKLERVMPATLRQRARGLSETTRLHGPSAARTGTSGETLMTLAAATQDGRRVHLGYRDDTGHDSQRDVDPYGLVYRRGRWYVTGWCHRRHDLRTFRLDRLETLSVLDTTFRKPVIFDAAAHLSRSIAGLPRAMPVEVWLNTDMETAAAELGDGIGFLVPAEHGVTLQTGTDSPRWFARQLARLPFPFHIRRSDELRAEVRELAKRLMRQAEDSAPSANHAQALRT